MSLRKCLGCGEEMDYAAPLPGDDDLRGPRPGDLSLCMYCGLLMAFDEELEVRLMTPQEAARVPRKERVRMARALRDFQRAQRRAKRRALH